jgi:hypothetical protein
MTRLEFLKAQLADIERLDCFYWQTEDPNRYETLGYLSRKDRRRELITELLMLRWIAGRRLESLSSGPPVFVLVIGATHSIQCTLYCLCHTFALCESNGLQRFRLEVVLFSG